MSEGQVEGNGDIFAGGELTEEESWWINVKVAHVGLFCPLDGDTPVCIDLGSTGYVNALCRE
jgi:hypothetical protein